MAWRPGRCGCADAGRARREGECRAEIKEDKGAKRDRIGLWRREGGQKEELRTELGMGQADCKQEPREGAGMSGAADAPASSPPQQGAGSREGGEHQPPLPFFGICLSAILSNFLCLSSSSRGKGKPARVSLPLLHALPKSSLRRSG